MVGLPYSFRGAAVKGVGGAEGRFSYGNVAGCGWCAAAFFADAHGFDDASLPGSVGGVQCVYGESWRLAGM